MDVEGEASQCAIEAADKIKEGGTEMMPTATPKHGELSRLEPAGEILRGMLVLWQERPQGERVLEEACPFGENRFRTYR